MDSTSWFDTTPATVATIPLMRVARPMMVDKSAEASDADEAEEISHDSNAEKRIDVETPPRKRPTRRMGR